MAVVLNWPESVPDVDAQPQDRAAQAQHAGVGTVKLIALSGILDALSGRQLRDDVSGALVAGYQTILIDFKAGTFIDSNGFGALVACLKKTREAGAELNLCGLSTQVRLVLELTGTDRIFDIFKDPDAFKQQSKRA
jgi:anti-sigma B factor antagonist